MGGKIVVVDEKDNFLREEEKSRCHEGEGMLHRAFSAFIFNDKNELLIQKRSRFKVLWPMHWSNSCCSHPIKGETYEGAAERRIREELGISCKMRLLFKFQYSAKYGDIGSENELCAVLAGRCGSKIKIGPDPKEIAEFKFVDVKELKKDIEKNPDVYTPWFKMELGRVLKEMMMG
ncbi:isopentenyl-diphosphate delta-isomerase [Candidatus Woesearchaeota archaeon CG10_big_fil_rev_8_21_14_0_10_44_13]|nr:MAG: isopentenyl-diphosphate delta-isomerase [Candidatus Woesearchaeota archaeon CG10_big_fil_rev_8_21_14_0_10_44_13]